MTVLILCVDDNKNELYLRPEWDECCDCGTCLLDSCRRCEELEAA